MIKNEMDYLNDIDINNIVLNFILENIKFKNFLTIMDVSESIKI